MEVRIGKVLAIAHDVQRRIRGEALFEIDQLLERYQKEKNRERFREKLEKIRPKSRSRYEIMSQMFQVFGKLEVLKADWKPYIESVEQKLFGQGEAFYQEAFARFEREVCKEERWEIYLEQLKADWKPYIESVEQKLFGQGEAFYQEAFARFEREVCKEERWEIYLEQLMVYFLFTYFCGAVYDEMAYEKAKFAVVSTLLIQEMVFASFLSHGKFPQVEEVAEIAHRYAKEVEHSDTNLKRLEELFQLLPFTWEISTGGRGGRDCTQVCQGSGALRYEFKTVGRTFSERKIVPSVIASGGSIDREVKQNKKGVRSKWRH